MTDKELLEFLQLMQNEKNDNIDAGFAGKINEFMKKKKEEKVLLLHTNMICRRKDGRFQTKKPNLSCITYDGLIDKLYAYYYPESIETLETLYAGWHTARQKDIDVAGNTVNNDQYIWQRFLAKSNIARIPIKELKASQIKAYYKSITAGRQITKKLLNNLKSQINSLLDIAVDKDIVEINIARSVSTRNLKCKIEDPSNNAYTDQERNILLNYLANVDTMYSLAIQLMFCLDVRVGELRALEWTDYNPVAHTIRINKQVRRAKIGMNYDLEVVNCIKGGTSKGIRTLKVLPRAESILAKLKALYPSRKYIFCNSQGGLMVTETFNSYLRRYCDAAGIRYLSSHKIRAWGITSQVEKGEDLTKVQKRSGHANLTTTLGYVRAQHDRTRDDTDAYVQTFS